MNVDVEVDVDEGLVLVVVVGARDEGKAVGLRDDFLTRSSCGFERDMRVVNVDQFPK